MDRAAACFAGGQAVEGDGVVESAVRDERIDDGAPAVGVPQVGIDVSQEPSGGFGGALRSVPRRRNRQRSSSASSRSIARRAVRAACKAWPKRAGTLRRRRRRRGVLRAMPPSEQARRAVDVEARQARVGSRLEGCCLRYSAGAR